MTTNRVVMGQNGYWECCCGHLMLFTEIYSPRRMSCSNRSCEHFGIPYREPSFELPSCEEPQVSRLGPMVVD